VNIKEHVASLSATLAAADEPGVVFAEFIATVLVMTDDPMTNWEVLRDVIDRSIAIYLKRHAA
jgi:hypothetical protein